MVRNAIVASLKEVKEQTFSQLRDSVRGKIENEFEGSVSWYFTTVKLDLEARGIIEHVGTQSPQKIRLIP